MSELSRQVGIAGAVLMGLGSIVGTGVFVSLGLGAELAGSALPLALLGAAFLALCNGLSSAQLAAAYPVSGGTYEYAHRTVSPAAGFTAGWMYLTAKSASAATAALGLAGYLLDLLGVDGISATPVAFGAVIAVTALVWWGIRRTNQVNAVVVSITLLGLASLALFGVPHALGAGRAQLLGDVPTASELPDVLHAVALMFVAYTGYGRIATLGEEVVDPKRTIPRSILAALAVVLVLYAAVAVSALGALGAEGFARATRAGSPLQDVARSLGQPGVASFVGLAAVTAMLGVLLNLVLGLSRVLLAMGRRSEMPAVFARIEGGTPGPAVIAMGGFIALLVLLGDVRTTWSFSALTVLVYYALCNLSALRLDPAHRLYPRVFSWLGLAGCASLTVWIEPVYWVAGGGLLALGFAFRAVSLRTQLG
ncbi:MAG: APC family permease [Deltaproteobacteria bacterium]|nr:MAG: APC family permease [Deltaproteobacteria bacterium]